LVGWVGGVPRRGGWAVPVRVGAYYV